MSKPPKWVTAGMLATIVFACGFWLGIEHSRGEIRAVAEQFASQPVNTFTKCLTEGWELSGELPPEWKGERKWVLR